ncbi:MAG: DUF4249 domain-containing protein [Bacteroidota bacterium]
MKRLITYWFLLAGLLTACEDIYNPDIDQVDSVIVADARLVYGQSNNAIHLYNSLGFNEKVESYPPVYGAKVTIYDNRGGEYNLTESKSGYYPVNFRLNPDLDYKLMISYGGNIYESSFEPVPKVPVLDSVYGIPEIKLIIEGGENDVNDIREKPGLQLYTDITSEEEMPYYRFTARKIMQYTYTINVPFFGSILPVIVYCWNSFYPQGIFNIASPPDYSNTREINKHPLFFIEERGFVGPDQSFAGWILILYQHGLSKSGHGYYKDLNSQLGYEGRLFDPLYVQARSNLKCINNPDQLILGNFEISTIKETRYFIQYISEERGYHLKPIPYFYNIPVNGEQEEDQPGFWEYPHKNYPDEQ